MYSRGECGAGCLAQAALGVLALPCPPVTRGEEVSAGAMDALGEHAQNAVLTTQV
jgi:hypothetical protein